MCEPTIAAAGIIGGVGLIEGSQNRRAAADAQKSQNALNAEQLALARDQDEYRRGLVDDMLAESTFSAADVEREVGRSVTAVNQAFTRNQDIYERGLMRMGINPNSQRFVDETRRQFGVGQALATAGAANSTRRGAQEIERVGRTQARMAGLGVSSSAIPVLGAQANQQGAYAAQYNDNAASALSAGASAAAYLVGRTPQSAPPDNSPLPAGSGDSGFYLNEQPRPQRYGIQV